MWRHEDFWRVLGGGIDFVTGEPLDRVRPVEEGARSRGLVTFPLSPLMHGGAQASLLMHLFAGQLTILEPKFDPVRTWEIVDREQCQMMFMTGDAMARPLIEAYEAGNFSGADAVRDRQQRRRLQQGGEGALDGPVPQRDLHRLGRLLRDRLPGHRAAGRERAVDRRPGRVDRTEHRGHLRRRQPSSTRRPTSARSGARRGPATSRSATTRTPRSRPRRSSRSTACATRSRATSPGSRRATGSRCSAAARTASTPAARRSIPKRSRWRSRDTRPSTTRSWWGCPTRSTARPWLPSSNPATARRSSSRTCATFLRSHLSGYKLPRVLTLVDEIPRNATGKAQYPAAKEMALSAQNAGTAQSATNGANV